jgi:hypothetical protein
VSIGSAAGSALAGGYNVLHQLAEANNVLTTVTISGFFTNSSELFILGSPSGNSNTGDGVVTATAEAVLPTKIASSLTLIGASATSGGVEIYAGATNTSGAGAFVDGESLKANITITYTGLTIKGGSGSDIIENDAKNGIVTDRNGTDTVILAGAGAKTCDPHVEQHFCSASLVRVQLPAGSTTTCIVGH